MPEVIERKLGIAMWAAPADGYVRPIILERAVLPTQPGDDSQVRGRFLAFADLDDTLFRGAYNLFVRNEPDEVIEIPLANVKIAVNTLGSYPCDAPFGVPVWFDFYARHVQQGGRQWSSHPWQRSLAEFAEARLPVGKPKKVKVAELRRLLKEGGAMLPEGPVRFDGEGRIRPGKN